MAKMDIEKKKCLTPEFRVSFPAVFEKKIWEGQEHAKYSLVMLFSKDDDITALRRAAHNAKIEKWGSDKNKWPANLRNPFRDGDRERAETPGYENTIFVTADSDLKPGLIDRKRQEILDPEEFYAGCYARAKVLAAAYDKGGNKGVKFVLQNIQKLREGEPFSGRRSAQEDIPDDLGDEIEAEDYGDEAYMA